MRNDIAQDIRIASHDVGCDVHKHLQDCKCPSEDRTIDILGGGGGGECQGEPCSSLKSY